MNITERVIIKALVNDMAEAGYLPAAVWDGEEYLLAPNVKDCEFKRFGAGEDDAPESIERALSVDEALRAIDTVDDCTLHFTRKNSRVWGDRGVFLVLGNGEDVIIDHHDPKGEEFTAVVTALYDKITNQALG